MSVTLLLGSRLGDLFGRRRVLLAGIAGFISASTLCALAPTAGTLIAARALQGAVAAIMVPQGFGLIRELFGDAGQQKAFGVFGPVMGLAAVAGPLVGGGLIKLDLFGLDWRTIFLVNVPLGTRRSVRRPALPASRGPGHARRTPGRHEHRAGHGRRSGARLPAHPGPRAGLAAVVLRSARSRRGDAGARLRVHQGRRARHGRTPLVEPSILRRRPYVAGLAVVVGFIGAMGGMMIALNVMFQTGLGFSPLACGVATVAIPVAAIAGSITSSALLARIGKTTMHIGIATMALRPGGLRPGHARRGRRADRLGHGGAAGA